MGICRPLEGLHLEEDRLTKLNKSTSGFAKPFLSTSNIRIECFECFFNDLLDNEISSKLLSSEINLLWFNRNPKSLVGPSSESLIKLKEQ